MPPPVKLFVLKEVNNPISRGVKFALFLLVPNESVFEPETCMPRHSHNRLATDADNLARTFEALEAVIHPDK